jgi:hypothetical protein
MHLYRPLCAQRDKVGLTTQPRECVGYMNRAGLEFNGRKTKRRVTLLSAARVNPDYFGFGEVFDGGVPVLAPETGVS